MLENKLASRDQKIYELEDEIKAIEDTTPITFATVCGKCESLANSEKNVREHDKAEHSDDNLPSTSNCGKCDFNSEDEDDLNQHIKSVHVISCDLCDFETNSSTEAEKHNLSIHNIPCENCNLTFNSDRKLSEHMCRMHILNPTCGDAYMKNWTIFDRCTRIFSKNLEKETVYLHSEQCINVKRCPDMLPYWDDIDMANFDGEIWHAPLNDFFSEGKISWKSLKCHFGVDIE